MNKSTHFTPEQELTDWFDRKHPNVHYVVKHEQHTGITLRAADGQVITYMEYYAQKVIKASYGGNDLGAAGTAAYAG